MISTTRRTEGTFEACEVMLCYQCALTSSNQCSETSLCCIYRTVWFSNFNPVLIFYVQEKLVFSDHQCIFPHIMETAAAYKTAV